jgi:hypothetical protein
VNAVVADASVRTLGSAGVYLISRPGELCQFDLWEPREPVAVGHGQRRRGWVGGVELFVVNDLAQVTDRIRRALPSTDQT